MQDYDVSTPVTRNETASGARQDLARLRFADDERRAGRRPIGIALEERAEHHSLAAMKYTRLARTRANASAEHARAARIDLQLPFGRDVAQALGEQLRPLPRGEIEIIPDKRDVSEHESRLPFRQTARMGVKRRTYSGASLNTKPASWIQQ